LFRHGVQILKTIVSSTQLSQETCVYACSSLIHKEKKIEDMLYVVVFLLGESGERTL